MYFLILKQIIIEKELIVWTDKYSVGYDDIDNQIEEYQGFVAQVSAFYEELKKRN